MNFHTFIFHLIYPCDPNNHVIITSHVSRVLILLKQKSQSRDIIVDGASHHGLTLDLSRLGIVFILVLYTLSNILVSGTSKIHFIHNNNIVPSTDAGKNLSRILAVSVGNNIAQSGEVESCLHLNREQYENFTFFILRFHSSEALPSEPFL